MKVLGPYLFQTEQEAAENNCGCGGEYCNLMNFGDKVTFQIPSSETCADFLAGCNELTASCISDQVLSSTFAFEQNSAIICFDLLVGASPGQIQPDDPLFTGSITGLTEGEIYKICFSVSNNVVPDDNFTVFINDGTTTWEGPITYQGNGTFCGYVTTTGAGAMAPATWGVMFKGGDDTVRLCLESMTLCSFFEPGINLVDSSGAFTQLSFTYAPNGNIVVNSLLSAELPAGCYTIQITGLNDEGIEWESNCINLLESHPCTLLLNWRNNSNAFGYDYSDTNYINYARIQARMKHPRWPWEKGDYLKSDNRNELTNAQQSKIHILSTGRRDNVASKGEPEYMHNAIASAILSDLFTVDGVEYRLFGTSGSYDPDWRNSSNLAHVQIELTDQDYDGVNRFCS